MDAVGDKSGVTRLVAAGDWFAQGRMPDAVRARSETAAILETLRGADIAFVNLETPLTRRGVRAEKQNTLRADPAQVEDLVLAGVDVVSLANNHMLDYGVDGLTDTLAVLGERGVRHVGAGATLEAARAPVVVDSPGGRVGFLAFASTLPQGFAAAAERPGVAPIHVTAAFVVENPLAQEQPGTPPPVVTFPLGLDVDATCEAVRALRDRADFVVVSAHWGVAGQDAIMDYQREVGRALIEAGGDLILGHHPHRLHGIEFHRGKPILYSLGNFVFEPLPPAGNTPSLSFRGRMTAANVYGAMRREGVLVDARLRSAALERLTLRPLLLDAAGYPMLCGERATPFATLLGDLSPDTGARFRVEDGAVVVEPARVAPNRSRRHAGRS